MGRLAAVPDNPRRVVAYVRVSALHGRGGDDFHSPDVQLSAIRRASAGLAEVAVIEDIDRTGRHFAREGIDRIRRMAQRHQLDVIAVYDVSRLGRNVRESLTFLAWLADQGVTIISACEQIDTSTPAGRWMLTNLLAIAELRSDEIGRSWSNTIAHRAERGQHHGRPLGYTRRDKRLVPDPVVGPAMTEVFRRYADGKGIGEVAAYLATKRGKPIVTANLKKALRSPVYLGKVVAGGEVLDGQHEALTDQDTWDKVQRRIGVEAKTPPRHLSPTWSLVGLCECPGGHKLQRVPHKVRGEVVNRLVCGMGRGQVQGDRCSGVGEPILDAIEAETLRQVADYASRLRTDHAARLAQKARAAAESVDRASLERELARAKAAMTKLASSWALGDVDDDTYRTSMAELRSSVESLGGELARLGPEPETVDPQATASAVEALLGMWPQMTFEERGRALRTVVARVEVRRAQRWREPESARVTVHFRW